MFERMFDLPQPFYRFCCRLTVQALGSHPVCRCPGKHLPFLDNCFLCCSSTLLNQSIMEIEVVKPNRQLRKLLVSYLLVVGSFK